jgi:hypothetical protein
MNGAQKVVLAARIWALAIYVHVATRRRALPEVVSSLARRGESRRRLGQNPVRLGRIVTRALTFRGTPPRCLIAALVAFRLNRAEGHDVEIVIGLPMRPIDKDAHAWLEINGRDVGPPPGQLGHLELARYS